MDDQSTSARVLHLGVVHILRNQLRGVSNNYASVTFTHNTRVMYKNDYGGGVKMHSKN